MKIQLDTENKVIRLEERVNVEKLLKLLEQLLPREWMKYDLEINNITNWINPIVIKEIERPYVYPCPQPSIPNYPWYPYVGDNQGTYVTCNGQYNVEVQ